MRYEIPLLDDLINLAGELEKSYQGTEHQSRSFIELYQRTIAHPSFTSLSDVDKSDLIMALLTFNMEAGPQTSYLESYWRSYPKLNEIIAGRLNITAQNPLNDDQKLIYLFKLFQFLSNEKPDIDFRGLYWASLNDFIGKLKDQLKVVKNRDWPRMKAFKESMPKVEALQKSNQQIAEHYKQVREERSHWNLFSRTFTNSEEHKKLWLLNRFINETCDEHYHQNVESKEANLTYTRSCCARLGNLLFMGLKIKNEYYFFSPVGGLFNSGSVLYQDSIPAMHQERLKNLDRDTRIDWLRETAAHLDGIIKHSSFDETVKKWEKEGLTKADIMRFQEEIKNLADQEVLKKNNPGWTGALVNGAVQGSLSYVATQQMAKISLMTLIGSAGGPIGIAVMIGGSLLILPLGRAMSDQIIPKAITHVYEWTLNKVAALATAALGTAMTCSFAMTKHGVRCIFNDPTLKMPASSQKFLEDWINTILSLPDDLDDTIKADKAAFRKVLGVDDVPEICNEKREKLSA